MEVNHGVIRIQTRNPKIATGMRRKIPDGTRTAGPTRQEKPEIRRSGGEDGRIQDPRSVCEAVGDPFPGSPGPGIRDRRGRGRSEDRPDPTTKNWSRVPRNIRREMGRKGPEKRSGGNGMTLPPIERGRMATKRKIGGHRPGRGRRRT